MTILDNVACRDILLLEAGFLTIIIAPFNLQLLGRRWPVGNPHDGITLWLAKWLLFRLMFASGVVKLTSHCPTWWGLSGMLILTCREWEWRCSRDDVLIKEREPLLEKTLPFSLLINTLASEICSPWMNGVLLLSSALRPYCSSTEMSAAYRIFIIKPFVVKSLRFAFQQESIWTVTCISYDALSKEIPIYITFQLCFVCVPWSLLVLFILEHNYECKTFVKVNVWMKLCID